MKKLLISAIAFTLIGGASMSVMASPAKDLKDLRAYYFKRFPGVPLQEYANGVYAIDKNRRLEWEAMEEFPPYEPAVDIGQELFEKYNVGSCFKNGGIGIKQNYPYFDAKSGKVRTLERDVMACLKKNKVDLKKEKLKFKKGKFAAIVAYMAYTSRGKKINVVVPNDKRALAIYNDGKTYFYAKRGQLNFSCADCHVYNSGMMIRTMLLSPGLGQVTHFPAYRKKWEFKGKGALGGLGTLQRRYTGCHKQVRAKPLKGKGGEQPDLWVALEYFHTYVSNGVKINAPGIRQ